MNDRKKAQMMKDLADLNSAAGMKQGVKSDVSLDKLNKNQTQTVMQEADLTVTQIVIKIILLAMIQTNQMDQILTQTPIQFC